MFKIGKNHIPTMLLTSLLLGLTSIPGSAAGRAADNLLRWTSVQ
jgi:hypothetical protein